jgi:hypothetical protein
MMRYLFVLVVCFLMVACTFSENDSSPEVKPTNSKIGGIVDLDPQANLLRTPPVDGTLPDELLPPR